MEEMMKNTLDAMTFLVHALWGNHTIMAYRGITATVATSNTAVGDTALISMLGSFAYFSGNRSMRGPMKPLAIDHRNGALVTRLGVVRSENAVGATPRSIALMLFLESYI